MTAIEKAKILLGLTDTTEDSLLAIFEEIAMDELGNPEEQPINLIAQMMVVKYQRKGNEVIASADYSDSREIYITNYPPHINAQINAFKTRNRKLVTL